MRILLQVAALMLGLFLIGAVRSHDDFDTSKPLTWILAAGFTALTVGVTILYIRMEHANRTRNAGSSGSVQR